MSFPRYPKYEDSNVSELGKIPSHWSVSRLGYEAWVRARLGWKGLKAEEYVDNGFAFLATPNIKGRFIDFENVNFISLERFDESPEIKIAIGDVLLAKDGSTLGTVNVVRELPRPTTVNSSIAVITPNAKLNGIYLYYLFAASYMEQTIQQVKGGMGVPHLFQSDLNKFYLPMPPVREQAAIAEFLDRETAKIDELVAEQRRLMELLKEKRQAAISHAVTKGLSPNAPMKPSGVEWLGDVPSHWIVLSLKRTIMRIEQGWSPDCFGRPAEPDEWGVMKSGCVNRGVFCDQENKALPESLTPMPEYEIRLGDVLMSRASGSPELVGSTALVSSTRPKLMLSDKIFRIHLREMLDPQFFVATFNSRLMRYQIVRAISGADGLANNLPQSSLKSFVCLLPPMAEQKAITSHLHNATVKFDDLIATTQKAVDLLLERRSALISAAVTGQIDVRAISERQAA